MTRSLPTTTAKRALPGRSRQPLCLSPEQRQTLLTARSTHPKAYVRERAAAILKVADGASPGQVARHGLLQPRRRDTVVDWIRRFRAEGLAGLIVRQGRGRKPAFSP